jgi:Domain of unknown function (DUF397)
MTATSHRDLSRATWRKSRRSNNGGNCIEVNATPGTVAVRDSKDPRGPVLVLAPAQWRAFTGQVKTGMIGPG